jgi:hypothetical protein
MAAFYFAALRADVMISKKGGTLELRPMIPLFRRTRTRRLPFAEIREFLVEPEFEVGTEERSAFVWHLTAVTVDGKAHRLTCHFAHDPILAPGLEVARLTGKPLREESGPLKSSTWSHWGYNFLR